MQGHGLSPLAFCGEKPENQFGSELWLTPRFGLAPTTVCAGAGAVFYLISLGWWRHRHLLFATAQWVAPLGRSYLTHKSHFFFFSLISLILSTRCCAGFG